MRPYPPDGPPRSCASLGFKKPERTDLAVALLEFGERGKDLPIAREQAFQEFERNALAFGIPGRLSTLPPGPDRDALVRMGHYSQNGSAIAAQMASGLAVRTWRGDPALIQVLDEMMQRLTEPTEHEPSLRRAAEAIHRGEEALIGMSAAPRAFARWVLRGYAFSDFVAIDAALAGYCSAAPSQADNALLARAVEISRRKKR